MTWTAEQQAAISREGSLIVSAAAGAGKTAVLTERIARLVAEGTPVDRLLVLTFTRAAAAEMKGRIERRLTAMAGETGDGAMSRYLYGEARAVGAAQISTIHAFCAGVLKRHGHLIGQCRDARVGDELEIAVLSQQVKDKLLTALSAQEDPDWNRLLSAFGGEEAAWNGVSAAYTFLLSQPDPQAFVEAALCPYQSQDAGEEALLTLVSAAKDEVRLMMDCTERAKGRLSLEEGSVISVLDEDLLRYRALLMQPDYAAYRDALNAFSYATLRFPKNTPEEAKEPVRGPRELCKKVLKEQKALFVRPLEEELAAMEQAGTILSALFCVEQKYTELFQQEKQARSLMDFSDLEHLALAVLSNGEAAREYREKFRYVAVDEYQDTSLVQEAILEKVTAADNAFYVGDVKQSIYRFRQAEPGLFLARLAAFSGPQGGGRIDLNENFRSAREVLGAVNEVFSVIMTQEAGEMAYDQRAMLRPGRTQPPGGAELHLIDRAGDEEEEEALESAADGEVEAMLVAARIRELMETGSCPDPATGLDRPLTYGDFALLLRSTTNAQRIAQTLSQCGIPCYAQSNGGYFDAVEVQVLTNLLRVIDNRRQDVPLLSVMRSSMGDFSPEELAAIRLEHPSGPFYEALKVVGEGEGPLCEKTADFLHMLDRYRTESRLVTIEELIGMLLDETGFYEEMGAGENGRQRQNNLNALLDKARAFEKSGQRGIWSFLQFMELAQNSASLGTADTAAANVVRILTIHKSKGLEFPVVFLCQTGARFNLRGGGEPLLLHGELGMGLKFLDPVTRVSRDTAYRAMLSRRLRAQQQAEEMRVLYVAMTRARQRLIITACVHNASEKAALENPDPSPLSVLRCSAPASWLLMGDHRYLRIFTHSRREFLLPPREVRERPLPSPDPALVAALSAKFGWRYPHEAASLLPAKAAVSRIGAQKNALPSFDLPAFVDSGQQRAAFFGTAMHAVLERLPLSPALQPEESDGFIQKLSATGALSAAQAERASGACLSWFLSTSLYRRMCASPRVERELAFGYEADAAIVFNTDADERVLLQGVIDCAFLEDGAWVLMDYKTDRVGEDSSPRETANAHMQQLAYYAAALAALTGKPVKERYVVLLTAREAVLLEGATP